MYIVFAFISLVFAPSAYATNLSLQLTEYKEIKFEDLQPTIYSYQKDGILEAKTSTSSSALIKAFNEKKLVKSVTFKWLINGELKTKDAAHEETKSGDDFPLRVGLCIKGDAPMIPFFAAAWIKKIAKILNFPSDKLIYLVAGSKHQEGETWESPYSSSIQNIALTSSKDKDEWITSSHKFSKALEVVGLWIMSDGDNTKSNFSVRLKDLTLR